MMIVFFGKGENDRVRLRGLFDLCVRGGIAICSLTYTELVI